MFRRLRKREQRPAVEPEPAEDEAPDTERDELNARIAAASAALGAAPPEEARLAAVERLTELKAEGKVSEETYQRERRRLLGG